MKNFFLMGLCLVGSLGLIFRSTSELSSSDNGAHQNQNTPFARIPTAALKILLLGQKRVFDDVLFLWLSQRIYPSSPDDREERDRQKLAEQVRSVVDRQPHIRTVYLMGCYALAFDWEKPQACEDITSIGMSLFPDDWFIPMLQGYVSTFELKDAKRGVYFYRIAAQQPEAPNYLRGLVAKLEQGQISDKTQAAGQRLLQQMKESIP